MKTVSKPVVTSVFECEKCGKQSQSRVQIERCEASHIDCPPREGYYFYITRAHLTSFTEETRYCCARGSVTVIMPWHSDSRTVVDVMWRGDGWYGHVGGDVDLTDESRPEFDSMEQLEKYQIDVTRESAARVKAIREFRRTHQGAPQ